MLISQAKMKFYVENLHVLQSYEKMKNYNAENLDFFLGRKQ